MVSRSNKECRPKLNHSGKTVKTGHGGLKRNMGAGASIKPKDEKSSGQQKLEARQGKPKSEAPKKEASGYDSSKYDDKSGIAKIGQAGADIVTERARRKKAKE